MMAIDRGMIADAFPISVFWVSIDVQAKTAVDSKRWMNCFLYHVQYQYHVIMTTRLSSLS